MLKEEILECLYSLNDKLLEKGVKGEICIYGGAFMCLIYEARPSTKDVDAVFQPTEIIRIAVREIAEEKNLPDDWLNDGVKGFLVDHPRMVFLNLPNLTVMTADPEYILAMKSLSARVDSTDKMDIVFLINKLKIDSVDEVLYILEKYYPRRIIKPAARFFLEEIFDEIRNG